MAGYRLDHFRDSQVEAALQHWNKDVSGVTINAKMIYRTLKRLKQLRGKHVQTPLINK